MTNHPEYTNDLIHELSPYLLQHAHNPVNWHAWNESNLAEAVKLGKPLLISIGYSACHWCHVMEHESFEDEEVALIMNNNFYCIKVDREERTDVDHLYMNAVQMITGRGGWPLNCFAFPDGRPFHGGTYFPKESWIKVLKAVDNEFRNNRNALETYANRLKTGLVDQSAIPVVPVAEKELQNKLDASVIKLSDSFDNDLGGLRGAPKFPMPSLLSSLQFYGNEKGVTGIIDFVDNTLIRMARGGIYDRLAGGFARYSVDALWKIPHFEKMLYDNAQLLQVYAQAYKRTELEEYRNVVVQTANFMMNELYHPSGLFYSALDADSEGVEGKFYIWTEEELRSVLGDDYKLAKELFSIDERGYWEAGVYVLLGNDFEALSSKLQVDVGDLKTSAASIRSRLYEHRLKRIPPGLDDKCILSWNAMAIVGLIEAGQAAGEQEYIDAAILCADAIENHFFIDGSINRIFKQNRSMIAAFSEDYAWLIAAWIKLYEHTGKVDRIEKARLLMEELIDTFYDSDSGFFTYRPIEQTELIHNAPELYDNVIPASNSVTCRNLIRLSKFYNRKDFRTIAVEMLNKLAPVMETHPSSFGNWISALLEFTGNSKELVISGVEAKEKFDLFAREYLPNVLLAWSDKDQDLPLFKDRFSAKTLCYVCEGNACLEPTSDAKKALEELR